MNRRACVSVTSLWAASFCLSGCTDVAGGVERDPPSLPLVGGMATDAPAYDAVGTIRGVFTDESTSTITRGHACMGTLIGARAVLTSRSCAQAVEERRRADVPTYVFGIGGKAASLRPEVEIVEVELGPATAPPNRWSPVPDGLGVVYLRESVSEVVPARPAAVDDTHVGQTFAAIGRREDAPEMSTERVVGEVHLAARRGSLFELTFGDFRTYFTWYTWGDEPPTDCADPAQSRRCESLEAVSAMWTQARLELGRLVLVGRSPSDAHPCHADRGGPLARADATGLMVYGLFDRGHTLSHEFGDQCELGATYSTFDVEALQFLARAATWVDPCGAVSVRATCAGDVAQRCTKPEEGRRRKVSFDCASVGLRCRSRSDGSAGCESPE